MAESPDKPMYPQITPNYETKNTFQRDKFGAARVNMEAEGPSAVMP